MRVLSIAIILAGFAAAQRPPAAAPDPAPATARTRIEGRVETAAGEPIPRASLRLLGVPRPGATPALTQFGGTADEDGNFVLEDLPAGGYLFTAEKPGFVRQGYRARTPGSSGAQLDLAAGQVVEDVLFRLTPGAVVSGKVLTPEGDPAEGKQVTLLGYVYNRGRRGLQMQSAARSDDQGSFRITGVAPGRYYLSAGENEFAGLTRTREISSENEILVTTYYPRAVDVAGAAPLVLAAGAEMSGLNIELRRERVYTLTVSALDQAGNLVPGTALAIFPKSNGSLVGLVSAMAPNRSATGIFQFPRLAPGTYIIQARPGPQALNTDGTNPPAPPLYGRLEAVITDKDVDDAVIRLTPNVEVTATVRVVDGDAEALTAGPLPLSLIEPEIPGMNNRTTQRNADGTYRFDSVPRSVYNVIVTAVPTGMYVQSVRFGGRDITRSTLDLTAGGGGQVEVVLSGRGAAISGTVRTKEDEPPADIVVSLWPATPDTSTMSGGARTVSADPGGAFHMENLAPGEYYLAAWAGVSSGQADSAGFRALFTGAAERIMLDEGAHLTSDVEAIPASEVERLAP